MIVNPAPGALVRDPVTRLVIADGTEVDQNDPYFARLVADGDLVAPPTASPARRQAAPASEDAA